MKPEFNKNYFREKLALQSIFITDIQIDRLFLYTELLLNENKKVNLISRNDETNVLFNHLYFSLLYSAFIPNNLNLNILDVGTGGGLPGIPLSIIYPNIKFLLIDGVMKKINSVNLFIKELDLKNVEAVQIRTEELAKQKSYLHNFDFVVSRSVSNLSSLINGAAPFLKQNKSSKLICLKGGDLNNELKAAKSIFKKYNFEVGLIGLDSVPEILNKDKKFVLVSLN